MKKISIIGVLVLIFLCIRTTELFLTHFSVFRLNHIEISGNEDLQRDEVLNYSGLRLKRNIFNIDLGDIEKRIEADRRVRSVTLRRVPPGKIQIRVEEKKPELLVNSKYLPKLYGLTAEGEVIPMKEDYSYDLPLINGVRSKNLSPYTKVKDKEVQTALTFYKMVKEENPSLLEKISEINLEYKSNLVVIMVNSGAKILFGAGDLKEKFKRFMWIDNDLKLEGYSRLDLRFKDQMVFKGMRKSL